MNPSIPTPAQQLCDLLSKVIPGFSDEKSENKFYVDKEGNVKLNDNLTLAGAIREVLSAYRAHEQVAWQQKKPTTRQALEPSQISSYL